MMFAAECQLLATASAINEDVRGTGLPELDNNPKDAAKS